MFGTGRALLWFSAVLLVNWLYNFGPRLSSNLAPLDVICPCGYLLVVPLSSWLNGLPDPPLRSWAHAGVLVLRTQLWLQTFDADADADADRRTSAVLLGVRRAQTALAALLAAETALVFCAFENWPLRSFSAISMALLVAQALPARSPPVKATISRTGVYAVFVLLGLGGLGLMVRVWLDGTFLRA